MDDDDDFDEDEMEDEEEQRLPLKHHQQMMMHLPLQPGMAPGLYAPGLGGMPSSSSGAGGGGASAREIEIREQDRYLPIANIARIMKKVLPGNVKVGKDAKESIQMCVSEFISFITSEASDKCQLEKRKTINGDDLLWAMSTLGFEQYGAPLQVYLNKYRESVKGEKPDKSKAASSLKRKDPPSLVMQPKMQQMYKPPVYQSASSSGSGSANTRSGGAGYGQSMGAPSSSGSGSSSGLNYGFGVGFRGSFDFGMRSGSMVDDSLFAMDDGLGDGGMTASEAPGLPLSAFLPQPLAAGMIINGRHISYVTSHDFLGIDIGAVAAASTANKLTSDQAIEAGVLALQMQLQQLAPGQPVPDQNSLSLLKQQMGIYMRQEYSKHLHQMTAGSMSMAKG